MGGRDLDALVEVVAFGPFELIPERRRLLRDGRPVPLGSRALDLLLTFVENAGVLLTKDQLIARVWPNTTVEEGALRVHMTTLRKVLSDGRPESRDIVNVHGRGYKFTVPTRTSKARGSERQVGLSAPGGIPAPTSRVVGRDDDVERVVGRLRSTRCVTIAGTGGIGKTTVALVVGRRLAAGFSDGAAFVDLSSQTQVWQVVEAIGAKVGAPPGDGACVARLADFLSPKSTLLLLDSCEHVVAEVAEVVDRLLAASPDLRVLATSREPLRVTGEAVHRLPPLSTPAPEARPTAREAMAYSAVELFVDRAAAVADHFELDDRNAPMVAGLCGRLDGLPLAIEMAATRMDAFGIADVVAMLEDRFEVLRRSRRCPSDRQSSLSATLDWSYGMLPARHKAFLRDLSVFSGSFSFDDAIAMTQTEASGRADAVELLGGLVDRSFVTADPATCHASYRLFETMREYVRHRTSGTPEFVEGRLRHARFVMSRLERADRESERCPFDEWLAEHGRHLDDVRSAIRWCLSDGNDVGLGVELTARAVTLWLRLSLVDEMLRHVRAAVGAARREPVVGRMEEVKLRAAASLAVARLANAIGEATRPYRDGRDALHRLARAEA